MTEDELLSDFDKPTENIYSVVLVLYQSGYLTIKSYTLGFPNKKVRDVFVFALLPYHVVVGNSTSEFHVDYFLDELFAVDIDSFLIRTND